MGEKGAFYLSKKVSQHYEKIAKLLRAEKQLTLGKAGILLGARFGALNNACDNCKISLNSYTVCIMKAIPPRQYCTIHILCETCRLLHGEEVKYYLYLNK